MVSLSSSPPAVVHVRNRKQRFRCISCAKLMADADDAFDLWTTGFVRQPHQRATTTTRATGHSRRRTRQGLPADLEQRCTERLVLSTTRSGWPAEQRRTTGRGLEETRRHTPQMIPFLPPLSGATREMCRPYQRLELRILLNREGGSNIGWF
jgi:hypothetical protein